jgi:hypothetical protein
MASAVKPALIKPADFVLLALILAAGVKTLPWLWTGTGRVALVRVENRDVMRLELHGQNRRATVAGALGPVELEWGEAGVRVTAAPCPNQICVRSGRILRKGHRLVCPPSHLAVAVEKGPDIRDPEAVDAVTF